VRHERVAQTLDLVWLDAVIGPAPSLLAAEQARVVEHQPVTLDRLAAASSWPVRDVESALRRHPGMDWDELGRLVGFGLTLRPTPHRFTFDGRTGMP
jgi:alkylmercury lyase